MRRRAKCYTIEGCIKSPQMIGYAFWLVFDSGLFTQLAWGLSMEGTVGMEE